VIGANGEEEINLPWRPSLLGKPCAPIRTGAIGSDRHGDPARTLIRASCGDDQLELEAAAKGEGRQARRKWQDLERHHDLNRRCGCGVFSAPGSGPGTRRAGLRPRQWLDRVWLQLEPSTRVAAGANGRRPASAVQPAAAPRPSPLGTGGLPRRFDQQMPLVGTLACTAAPPARRPRPAAGRWPPPGQERLSAGRSDWSWAQAGSRLEGGGRRRAPKRATPWLSS